MSLFNFAGGGTPLHLLAAGDKADTAAATGAAVDLLDYEAPIAVVQSHGTGTGTLVGKIQDSANGSSGWADVTGAAFTSEGTTAGIQALAINPKQVRRYIRYVGTITTGPQNVGVVAFGVKKSV